MTTPGGNLYGDGGLEAKLQDIFRRLGALERSDRLTGASIGSGGLTIKDGGALTAEDASGDPQVVLDSDGLDIGQGEVVLDNTGLQVVGGYVTPILPQRRSGQASNLSLSTTIQTAITMTFAPPSWAETMILWASAVCGMSENTLQKNIEVGWRIDTGTDFDSAQQTVALNATETITIVTGLVGTSTGISLPSGFNLHVRARVNAGTNSTNSFLAIAQALFMRSP